MKPISKYLVENKHIAPLITFRILFGSIMFVSIIRFILMGWVHDQYIMPRFFFPYYGFEWVKPLGPAGMYAVFIIMALAFLMIALGSFYRIATIIAFLCFTYVELIDKTNYLNHYYFVSIVTFLLIFLPAHRYFSVDVKRKPAKVLTEVPAWTFLVLRFQLGIVYFFAGLAKLNSDWLFYAMPLKIWLPAHADLPLVGTLLAAPITAYFFSWAGALYDLSIPFLLSYSRTRIPAYLMVIVFHLLTAWLFPIGMFPYIMILSTLVFFPVKFHEKLLNKLNGKKQQLISSEFSQPEHFFWLKKPAPRLLYLFFLIQLLLPLRFMLYPGNVFWTEEGYRFSWRVMLMEKAGYATFHVEDASTGRKWEVRNYDYLTPNQEKMMSTQPDMILQFAHFLKEDYRKSGIADPRISVENYVTLNGRRSQLMIDPLIDLSHEKESFLPKKWILPFRDE